jgi:hypothetical protein
MTGQVRLVLGTAAVLLLGVLPAAAQNSPGSNFTNREAEFTAPTAMPRALPGSRVSGAPRAAPAQEQAGPSDLSPNDALFDAVNRGDLAAARDAVSRGARLDVENILGLTPIDLAIDLGRNEIMFMLLSMRPAIGGSAPPPREARAAPRPAPRPAPQRVAPVRVPEPTPVRQRQHSAAADGMPVPSAGFLGFGGPGR